MVSENGEMVAVAWAITVRDEPTYPGDPMREVIWDRDEAERLRAKGFPVQASPVRAHDENGRALMVSENGGKGWRPIESAPRDGRSILAADDIHGAYVCWWDIPNSHNGHWMTIARYDFDARPARWFPIPALTGE